MTERKNSNYDMFKNFDVKDIVDDFKNEMFPRIFTEDIGPGDITTEASIRSGQTASAEIYAKENLVLCGLLLAQEVLKRDPKACERFTIYHEDGDRLKRGDRIFSVSGDLAFLLKSERVLLNLLQRLSGIATQAAVFADELKPYSTKILDTRKTTPGYRLLEKYAVKTGGAVNHRTGLFDMFLIKDNHIAACGGIREAVKKSLAYKKEYGLEARVEVECKTLKQVEEAVPLGVDVIMLDNMDNLTVKKALDIIDGQCETEVSGNITRGRLASLGRLGVTYISSGALTHSAKAADIAMEIS